MIQQFTKLIQSRFAESSVLQNMLALILIQVAQYSLPLITLPYLVRVLGIERFGLVSFAIAFVQYFITLTDYGFNLSASRETALHRRHPAEVSRIVSSVLAVRLLFFLISVGICLVVTTWNPKMHASQLLVLVALTSVGGSLTSLNYFFQGIERMKFITALSLSAKAVYTISLFLFVHHPDDYLLVPFFSGITETLAGLIGLTLAVRHFGVRLRLPRLQELVQQLKLGWPVFCSTVSISAYTATRTFAIGLFADARTVGYYALAERITTLLQMFPLSPVLAALYPRLSSMYARAPRATYRLITQYQRYTTLGYLVAAPLIALLLPFGVRLLSKELAPETVLVCRLLLVYVFFTNVNAFRVQFLLVAGAAAAFARIHAVAGIIGSFLVVMSAWRWSYLGPPVTMIIISFGILVWTRIEVKRLLLRQRLATASLNSVAALRHTAA